MRIGISGTQSVGKSSLVNGLRKKPQFTKYKFFTERSEYLNSIGVPLNKKSTFNGQLLFMAERARELMESNMITDRSTIDVAAFTEASDMDIKAKTGILFLLMELACDYDVLFYIEPVLPLKKNGVRDMNKDFRKEIDENIKKLLSHPYIVNKVHVIQSRTLKDRVDEVLSIIKNKRSGG